MKDTTQSKVLQLGLTNKVQHEKTNQTWYSIPYRYLPDLEK